jgi:serine/threonine-protein kinase RsbW
MSSSSSTITASVPAGSEYIHILRTVVCGVAGRLGFTIDDIDDLRLVVDEAAAQLLTVRPTGAGLELRLELRPDGLGILLVHETTDGRWPPADFERSMGWHVLTVLADDLDVQADGGRPAIRMTKRVPARPEAHAAG